MKSNQKVCRFTISKVRDPKQEFAIYEVVPLSRRREALLKIKEKELQTEISGYKVTGVEIVGLAGSKNSESTNKIASQKANNRNAERPSSRPRSAKSKGYLEKLEHLTNALIEIKGAKSLIFVDKTGRVIYRDGREDNERGEDGGERRTFKMDSAEIWTLAKRVYSLFKTVQADDSALSETQFIVIGRKDLKAIYLPIQPLDVILRIAIDKNQEARIIADQAQSLIAKHLS